MEEGGLQAEMAQAESATLKLCRCLKAGGEENGSVAMGKTSYV